MERETEAHKRQETVENIRYALISPQITLLNKGFEGFLTNNNHGVSGKIKDSPPAILHSHLFILLPGTIFHLETIYPTKLLFQIPFNQSFFLFQISKLDHPSSKVRTFPRPQVHMHHSSNRRCSPFPQPPAQTSGHRSSPHASFVNGQRQTRHLRRARESPRRAFSNSPN